MISLEKAPSFIAIVRVCFGMDLREKNKIWEELVRHS